LRSQRERSRRSQKAGPAIGAADYPLLAGS
jgi:hypothetical protein